MCERTRCVCVCACVCGGGGGADEIGEYVTYGYECSKKKII